MENKLKWPKLAGVLLLLTVGFLGVLAIFSKPTENIQPENIQSMKQYQKPPDNLLVPGKNYQVLISTDMGDFKVKLDAEETPKTVNNFVFLSREGFYNGTVFHRVIKGFMIQGGDPKGDGTGGPGYDFEDEVISKEYKRGALAMANRGPDTNGSQFFIMHQDYPLPKDYVIFGEVIEGMDVIDKIAGGEVVVNQQGEGSQPAIPVHIKSLTINEF